MSQDMQLTVPDAAAHAARDQALAGMFRPGELIWVVGESYDEATTTWLVDVVRQGPQGRWMRQRYRYDVPNDIVHFRGERPVTDCELAILRRNGKRFRVSKE